MPSSSAAAIFFSAVFFGVSRPADDAECTSISKSNTVSVVNCCCLLAKVRCEANFSARNERMRDPRNGERGVFWRRILKCNQQITGFT